MKVRNVKTKKVYTISQGDWVKIGNRGEQGKYIVVESGNTSPSEAKVANYGELIKDAKIKFKDNKFDEALDLYEKAYKIKETKTVKEKIAEIKGILELNK